MTAPPPKIDGATVVEYAWSDSPFGLLTDSNDKVVVQIHGLALCQYAGSSDIYRFSCDEKWESEQDSIYYSIDDAKNQLPKQYTNAPIEWIKI